MLHKPELTTVSRFYVLSLVTGWRHDTKDSSTVEVVHRPQLWRQTPPPLPTTAQRSQCNLLIDQHLVLEPDAASDAPLSKLISP